MVAATIATHAQKRYTIAISNK